MGQSLIVLSAGEARCLACSFARFRTLRGWLSPQLFLSRFPLGVFAFFFQIPSVRGENVLPLFGCFIDKRKSDRYMNLSGKRTFFW